MARDYILIAAVSLVVGLVAVIFVITLGMRAGLRIMGDDIWVLVLPAVFAIILNIILLEIYHRFKRKKS